MEKKTSALDLFIQFLKFGCFTFGGGWSIIAQIQKVYVEEQDIITSDELLDLTSVGRSIPGTMIGNVAMLFGYRTAGILGGLACVFGMIIPPFLVLIVVTNFYSAFRDNLWVAAAMNGVRAAVAPIIITAVMKLAKGAFKLKPCYIVAAVILFLYMAFDLSCLILVAIGAVCGVIISEYNERQVEIK